MNPSKMAEGIDQVMRDFLEDASSRKEHLFPGDEGGYMVVKGRVLDLYIITSTFFDAIICDGKVLMCSDGGLSLGSIIDAIGDRAFRVVESRHVEHDDLPFDANPTAPKDEQVLQLYRQLFEKEGTP